MPAPSTGSLLVRGTNSHIKPALKGASSRARPVGDAARRESGGIGSIASGSAERRPYSNQRCGCECNEQTEGLHRGCCYLRQPLSLTSFDSSPAGEPFGLPQTKSCPRKRGKWHGEAMTKGERLGTAKLFFYSPSVGLRRQLPRKRWSLLVLPPSSPYPWAEHEYEREYLKATE